jgi:hypothetical protein
MCKRLLKKRDSKETEPAGNLALKIISTLEQLYSSESKETDKVLSSKLIAR